VRIHRTPTGALWLNQEISFSILEGRLLQGAPFTSAPQLREHIDVFVDSYNVDARQFVLTKAKFRQRPFKGGRISQL
jgi:hypothetical protein